jgi:hypothetical protein
MDNTRTIGKEIYYHTLRILAIPRASRIKCFRAVRFCQSFCALSPKTQN